MRQRLTEPERRLWVELRAKRFHGAKFRRQQVIGSYIADFACRSPMLVIEVDGDSHADRAAYDAARTAFLSERGYRVLRFTNDEITQNIGAVLRTIETALRPPQNPLSPSGEKVRERGRLARPTAGREIEHHEVTQSIETTLHCIDLAPQPPPLPPLSPEGEREL